MDADGHVQRIRRVGLACVVLTVGALIWAMATSYWLIWLIAVSFGASACALFGEYRKARAGQKSTGLDAEDTRQDPGQIRGS